MSAPGSATVNIGGQPAARAGDRAACAGPPDLIVQGSPTVFIDGRPAARVGDRCGHSGVIVTGCPTVIIGDQPGGGGTPTPPPAGAGGRRRRPPIGGGVTTPGGPVPGAPGIGRGLGGAVPKPPVQKPPAVKTGKEPSSSKEPAKDTPAGGETETAEGPRLFGSPATMELIRAVARLAQQMIPGLASRVPPVDPQVMQATVAELREAIARKDVQAVNEISARLTAMMQPPAGAGGGSASPAASAESASPWIIPGSNPEV